MEDILTYLGIGFSREELIALGQVILIDITLAGDNAIIIGMTAARVAPEMRKKVIFYGLLAAVIMRIMLAGVATQILAVLGLTLAGGILLLWVSWRLYRDIKESKQESDAGADAMAEDAPEAIGGGAAHARAPTGAMKAQFVSMNQAIFRIMIADLSMSLDNVLAVAGAAMHHMWVLVLGLALSVALMGAAAVIIARMLKKYPWLAYAGLLMIVYVSVKMIYDGGGQVFQAMKLW
jgi:YjbE family integral membrane protein